MPTPLRRSPLLLCLILLSLGHPALSQDLLDPFRTPPKPVSGAAASAPGDGPFRASASEARAMSQSIVHALEELALEGNDTLDQIRSLEQNAAVLGRKAGELEAAKDAYMAEYRSGLFCSGCQQSRSQILAKHEPFPHPGMHIVKPTEAEIQAKDAALQAPIDRALAERQGLQKRLAELKARLNDILEQLEFGVRLWRTAATCEENLILQETDRRLKQDRSDKDKADRQVASAFLHLSSKDPKDRAQAEADTRLWKAVAEKAETQQARDLAWARQAIQAAETVRQAEQREIDGFLGRGKLSTRTSLSASFTRASVMASHPQLGGNFRMGALRPEGVPYALQTESPLASVDQFIARFRASDSRLTLESLTSGGLKRGPAAPGKKAAPGSELARPNRPTPKPKKDDLLDIGP